MHFVEDELIARQLQNELHCAVQVRGKENHNPVDSHLEFTDPTPSVHDLFVKFDKKFFWGSLGMVEVAWSKRMTSCAGVCAFQGTRGLCKISLSAPLLSLRPRKNLVETLLHEMIHAYLFITNNYKDRDDHGPEFHKHMNRINKEAGTNITVYHTFHDEVEYYQRHIWRCNGPCRERKPFYGFVKRAMNRAPGPHDFWWKRHQAECDGVFFKISEPEKPSKRTRKDKVVEEKCKDIRSFFTAGSGQQSNVRTLADLVEKNPANGVKAIANSGALVIGKKKPRGGKEGEGKSEESKLVSINSTTDAKEYTSSEKVREVVRNFWSNKFPSKPKVSETQTAKKMGFECPMCGRGFPEEKIQSHMEDCLKNNREREVESGGEVLSNAKECPVCSEKVAEPEMSEHLENCLHCSFVNEDEEKEGEESKDEVECQSVPCPCCYKWFLENEMNSHLDDCLTLNALKEEMLVS